MTSQADYFYAENDGHIPVMLAEVLETLSPRNGGVYVDGTFGAGGYTQAILNAANCTVYAIDRDPDAFARAQKMAQAFPGRLFPLLGCFGSVAELLATQGISKIDGLVLDLGVSSIQLSSPERGFSFRHDGPLDMRMSKEGLSAADLVNQESEQELARILFTYGEERASRKIAKKIIAARAASRIETTKELADIIHSILPMHGGIKTDTATRSFQALRIFVNDELGELERALTSTENLLQPQGRLVVVSFHSLEDWRVKQFLREKSGKMPGTSRHLPSPTTSAPCIFHVEKSNGIAPSVEETTRNPRARSARLRYGIRLDATGVMHA